MRNSTEYPGQFTRTGSRKQHTRVQSKPVKKALFITCTEATLSPAGLTRIGPDRLFELRNLGNIIPKSGANIISSDMAAIQYALHDRDLRDIIVCGHSGCTAVSFLLDRRNTSLPLAVKRWLSTANSQTACQNAAGVGARRVLSRPQIDTAARAHLAVQVANLLQYPTVAAGRKNGELRLHAWFYNEVGQVESLPTQDYLESIA
ncbi:carbonic anhydrase [Streptomyces viridiviolaceus]|uniref:carbonic anhydrase n=1 Tax=Streptomyces viridiviolaceus TaxID=68282 RepID=A0ABW2E2U4_9ACTN|nr:carbonic anhydrase [Streptomyces viridiviolaceus]GHB57209.1 carbonic anhydrase [Streptomyces viridiviolaceus]